VNEVTVLVQLPVNNTGGRSTRTRQRIRTRSTEENKRSACEEFKCETVIIPVLRAVAGRRLVETGRTSACATAFCKLCKSSIALYCCM
jgi:hypothetical protein